MESAETPMDSLKMKMHIMKGNREILEKELSKISRDSDELLSLAWKPHNSKILHVAAEAGHLGIISYIVQHNWKLLYQEDGKGDLPIHVALKASQKDAVWKLVEEEDQMRQRLPDAVGKSQLEVVNKDKNTALHIALENRFKDLSRRLLDKSPLTFSSLNEERISPLYLAIQARYFDLVKEHLLRPEFDHEQVKSGRSVVHEAIMAKNQEVLNILITKCDELKYLLDDKGRTPLSYAAEIGFVDGVNYLLNDHPELACEPDEDGSYPIHMACKAGNIHFVELFFQKFTNTRIKFWLNKEGQNILHTAAKNGQVGIVKYLLRKQRIYSGELINMIDESGDTPLHLATAGKHPKAVDTLAADERIDREIQNKQGLTALDLVETCYDAPSLRKRLTWMALLYANVPRSVPVATGFPTKAGEFKYKDRFDILLVVSTLVATVTFSATFTMPGGYSSSHNREGTANLAHRRAFQVFIFSNTLAMYSSVFSAVTLIWAHLDDIKLSLLSLKFALSSLAIALIMMTVAFMSGLFAVLHTVCEWLAIVNLILGGLFLVAFLALFIPLYSPTSHIRNKFVHYNSHFVFRLMLWACS